MVAHIVEYKYLDPISGNINYILPFQDPKFATARYSLYFKIQKILSDKNYRPHQDITDSIKYFRSILDQQFSLKNSDKKVLLDFLSYLHKEIIFYMAN